MACCKGSSRGEETELGEFGTLLKIKVGKLTEALASDERNSEVLLPVRDTAALKRTDRNRLPAAEDMGLGTERIFRLISNECFD